MFREEIKIDWRNIICAHSFVYSFIQTCMIEKSQRKLVRVLLFLRGVSFKPERLFIWWIIFFIDLAISDVTIMPRRMAAQATRIEMTRVKSVACVVNL